MSNDLAGEVTGRVKRLLDGLLSALIERWLPGLPFLGQRLHARYLNWIDGLFARLHTPPTSALLMDRSSNPWLSPPSYAWFDRRWISRRKMSRSFRRQSESEKDDDTQRVPVPTYFFEEDAGEAVIEQPKSAGYESEDMILSVPMLTTSSATNRESTQTEQLAKTIALRLELLTGKGSPSPRHTPFEASDVPSSLQTVSRQHIGKVQAPVPMMFLPMAGIATRGASPFVTSSEGRNFDSEPSGALPAALAGQSASEGRIAFLSHLSESPSMTSNTIPAGQVFSRLQNVFAPPVARSSNLMGKALADSPSYLLEPPQVASDAIRVAKADAVPASYPEEPPLFYRDQAVDMSGLARRYLHMVAPQPPFDNAWEPGETRPWHGLAGHIPSSRTEKAMNQEVGEPVRGIASTVKNSSFGGYHGSGEVGLALAPVGRQRENIPAAVSSAASAGQGSALQAVSETMPAHDPEALASEVYGILKRRLRVEKERATSVIS